MRQGSFSRHRRAIVAAVLGAASGAGVGLVQAQELPKSPVVINVIDAAGNLALTQGAFEAYQAQNPKLVSKFTFTKAPAPEIPAKIKAMQGAGRSDIDMIIVGTDALAAGLEMNLWVKLFPDYAAKFPKLMDNYLPNAYKMHELAKDHGAGDRVHACRPAGRVQPRQGQDTADHAPGTAGLVQGQPNKLIYARPANSVPGAPSSWGCPTCWATRTLQGPGQRLGQDLGLPEGARHLHRVLPDGHRAVMKELGEGSRDMTLTVTGWDINPRALGIVPKNYKVLPFKGMTWVNDAHYIVIPKGVTPEKQAVVLDLMAFLLKPQQQAMTYDKGYFYPGPAWPTCRCRWRPRRART
jgi:putative spermidine/putrescine transport system substrate-binding protein